MVLILVLLVAVSKDFGRYAMFLNGAAGGIRAGIDWLFFQVQRHI